MPVIATQFGDSTCVRCHKRFAKGDQVNWSRPIGVWCIQRCIPEFDEPEGALGEAVEVLERLEFEGRLKPYTAGMLERYRVFGTLSEAHIYSVLPGGPPELEDDPERECHDAEALADYEEELRTGRRKCPECGRRKVKMMLRHTRNYGGGWDTYYRCENCDHQDVAV